MKRKTDKNQPEPRGGRAAKRLQEFIEQRIPSSETPVEGAQDESQSSQQGKMYELEQKMQEMAEIQRRLEDRINQLEKLVQRLAGTQGRSKPSKK